MAASSTGRPVRILSLDGGGIRGVASLFVLQDLMLRIKVQENLAATPRPCDWFDLIIGASTGGIIALILGRLKMSVNEAIDAYKLLAEEVFSADINSSLDNSNVSERRNSTEKLGEAVRNIAGEEMLADPEDEPKCRVATVAVMQRAVGRFPDLFRTYKSSVPPYDCTILDAAMATAAATIFFQPAEVQVRHGRQVTYLDGGLGCNNPSSLAVQEAEHIWGPDRMIGCIISIGTGISPYVRFEGNKLALARQLLDISTDCQAVHMSMDRRFGGMKKRMYFRFDPPQDLAVIGFDEWEKLDDVADLVHGYLQEVQVQSGDCVFALTHPVGVWLLFDSLTMLSPLVGVAHLVQIQDIAALRTAVQLASQQDVETMRSRTPKSIPPFPAPFFGREHEVNDIVRVILSTPGVGVAILGAGGIGKSEVATAVLHHHRVEEAYGAFRFFVRCDSATASSQEATAAGPDPAGQLVSLIATQLGLDVSGANTDDMGMPHGRAEERLLYFFSQHPAVLVLDNFEALWDRSGPELDGHLRRLRALQNLRLIVTMRGDVTPGVSWLAIVLDTLDVESAKEVFISCSGKVEFRSDPMLDKILDAVECLPLAVVLLATQAKTKTGLQSLWKEWERCRTDMVEDERYREGADGARLLSLEASIEVSLNRPLMVKNPPARTLLSLLSVLPDGASWGDLEALLPSSSLSRKQRRPEQVLLQLSLAYIKTAVDGQPSMTDTSRYNVSGHRDRRLQVLAPIREYVQRLFAPEEKDYQRLRQHYLGIAISHATSADLRRLGPDIHNLEAVTAHALSIDSERALAVHSADALCDFAEFSGIGLPALRDSLGEVLPLLKSKDLSGMVQYILGRMALFQLEFDEARGCFDAARQLYGDDKLGKAKCIRRLGEVALNQLKYEEAREAAEEALTIFDDLADWRGKADCIRNLAIAALDQARYEEAGRMFAEAFLLYQEANHRLGMAQCVGTLSVVALNQPRYEGYQWKYEGPRQRLEEALGFYEDNADKQGKARCIAGLGIVALYQLEYEMAGTRLVEALALLSDLTDLLGKARCISGLGILARSQSRYAEARWRLEEALVLYGDLNFSLGKATCIFSLGCLSLDQSKYEEAGERFEEALAVYADLTDKQGKTDRIPSFGHLALYEPRYEESRDWFEEALELYKVTDTLGRAKCISSLGRVALNQSKYEEARQRVAEALVLYEGLNDKQGKADCLRSLGCLEFHESRYEGARDWFEAALLLYGEVADRQGKAQCFVDLGEVAFNQSKYEEARDRLEQALALCEEVCNRLGMADCLHALGRLALIQSNYEETRYRLGEALSRYEEIDNGMGKAKCICGLGEAALHQSRYDEARERLGEALAMFEDLTDWRGQADCVHSLGLLALNQSHYPEARAMFEAALMRFEEISDKRGKADCLRGLGLVAVNQSKYEEGTARFAEALALYEDLADRLGEARCISSLGKIALDHSKYEEARDRFNQAIALNEALGDKHGKANCLRSLGLVAVNQSKHEEAAARIEEALALYEDLADRLGEARCISSLGKIALDHSKYEEARDRFNQAIALNEALGDKQGKADCLRNLGSVAISQSKYEEAAARIEEALALYEDLADRRGKAWCISSLGKIALDQSNYKEATNRLELALALCEELTDRHGKADCLRNLGSVAVNQSKYEEGTARFAEALALYEDLADRLGEARCISSLGKIALDHSKYEEARDRFNQAIALNEALGDKQGKAGCLRNLGSVAFNQSKYEEAAARIEEALALYEDLADRRGKASCIHDLRLLDLSRPKREETRDGGRNLPGLRGAFPKCRWRFFRKVGV